ncbi:MAG: helix-turn-helix transcriptional regulator [Burkholderiales bacterium]|jgi:transcriptional regulator with XRE-family HTH domain|nr:helix-turn-helix transcriptional regulator [Burkholderiales bacterium]
MKKQKPARAVLAANLQSLRGGLGVTQEKLAEMAGFHRTYISHVETQRANVTLDNLEQLAAVLDVRVFELLVEH